MVSDDNAVAPISSLLAGTGIVMKENNYVYDSEEGNINHTEASGSQHMYISQYYNRDDWRYNHDIKPNMKFIYIYIYKIDENKQSFQKHLINQKYLNAGQYNSIKSKSD